MTKENKDNPVKCLFPISSCTEDHGDILIRGLWTHGTDCIINVCVTDVDAKSNRSKDLFKVLAAHEHEKKKNILRPASDNVVIFLHSWYQRMDSLAKKQKPCPRNCLPFSPRNGRNPTWRFVDTSMLKGALPYAELPTSAFKGPKSQQQLPPAMGGQSRPWLISSLTNHLFPLITLPLTHLNPPCS
jgi:hypothetical protein